MHEPGTDDQVRAVAADEWVAQVQALLDDGYTIPDMLTAVDEVGRAEEFRVVLRLCRLGEPHGVQLHTRLPRDGAHLPTVTHLLPGLAWHERETHDMFGIVFDGGDPAPLLNHDPTIHPLRKDVVLGARTVVAWPGAKEPGEGAGAPSRRKMVPPGVPDATVWGDRDPALGPATPDEVAAAVAGGRVRRRR